MEQNFQQPSRYCFEANTFKNLSTFSGNEKFVDHSVWKV